MLLQSVHAAAVQATVDTRIENCSKYVPMPEDLSFQGAKLQKDGSWKLIFKTTIKPIRKRVFVMTDAQLSKLGVNFTDTNNTELTGKIYRIVSRPALGQTKKPIIFKAELLVVNPTVQE
jgi:hypothetical protein